MTEQQLADIRTALDAIRTPQTMGKGQHDLRGRRFNRLLAIRDTGKRLNRTPIWECLCDCGGRKEVRAMSLVSGNTGSCGCLHSEATSKTRRKDITGQRFGRLRVIAPTQERRCGHIVWECICDCGNTHFTRTTYLIQGLCGSCGCLHKEKIGALQRTHGQSKTPAYLAHKAMKRKCGKTQRTPKWADLDAIQDFYRNCPAGLHVDHVIPLHGKLVSGLHIRENLQYLTQMENSRKLNKFEPQFITQ